MSRKKRGFTLVELLVVITIIGMLVGLLMPAVQSAREAGRRAQCMNNQHQISSALLQYESERGSFPGYVGEYRLGSGTTIVQRKISWWVSILPYLGRMDINDLWKDLTIVIPGTGLPGDNTVPNNPIPGVLMKIAVCPSYSPPSLTDAWLSYRGNVGRMMANSLQGATPSSSLYIPAEGVFTDQCQDTAANPANPQEQIVRVGLGFIDSKDGSSCTLLISENSASVPPTVYAFDGRWSPINLPAMPGVDGVAIGSIAGSNYYQTENNATRLGFNWGGMDPENPNKSIAPNQKIYSNHPGGVIASFCDGHQYFLRTDIEPVIFMQLMCPFDRGVFINNATIPTGIRDPLNAQQYAPPLDDSKY